MVHMNLTCKNFLLLYNYHEIPGQSSNGHLVMQPLKDGSIVTLTYNRPDGYPHVSLMIVFYSTLIDQYVFATYANSTKMNAFKKNDLVTINYGNLRKNETAVFLHGQAISLNREEYDDVYREMFYKHKQMMQYYFDTPDNPNY